MKNYTESAPASLADSNREKKTYFPRAACELVYSYSSFGLTPVNGPCGRHSCVDTSRFCRSTDSQMMRMLCSWLAINSPGRPSARGPTHWRSHACVGCLDEDNASSGLWADFTQGEKEAEGQPLGKNQDSEDSGPMVLREDGWDEPTGPEELPPGVDVVLEPIATYLPLLMQRKYGDDWELLLADGDSTAPSPAEGTGDVFAPVSDGDDESQMELPPTVQNGGDDAIEDGALQSDLPSQLGASRSDEAGLVAWLATASPQEVAAELSPQLGEFLLAQRGKALPKPFPLSEWQQIYLTAITSESRYVELTSTWANLRVCLAENFDDLAMGDDPATEPDAAGSALRKAQALHAATGMPALAETTCCHVSDQGSKPPSETIYNVDDTVDELILRMRPSSAPEREVLFTSAGAYVDADATVVGTGVCSMPLGVAEARHATIATSTALDDLFVKVAEAKGLKFVGSSDFEDFYQLQEVKKGGKLRRKKGGSLLLQQKILREAEVLDASILKVSSFLNHMVDVELMEACGEELAERLEDTQATKVLTVEATGLLPGMFVGKALQLPVVFARKSRQIGVSDSYQTSFKSSTRSTAQDLYVSTEYLNPGDRVLIIDDFLAGGTTADALIRLCRMAGATVVGGGVLIEKINDAGRAFLSGYEIKFESLAVVEIKPSGQVECGDSAQALAALADETSPPRRVVDGVESG